MIMQNLVPIHQAHIMATAASSGRARVEIPDQVLPDFPDTVATARDMLAVISALAKGRIISGYGIYGPLSKQCCCTT